MLCYYCFYEHCRYAARIRRKICDATARDDMRILLLHVYTTPFEGVCTPLEAWITCGFVTSAAWISPKIEMLQTLADLLPILIMCTVRCTVVEKGLRYCVGHYCANEKCPVMHEMYNDVMLSVLQSLIMICFPSKLQSLRRIQIQIGNNNRHVSKMISIHTCSYGDDNNKRYVFIILFRSFQSM